MAAPVVLFGDEGKYGVSVERSLYGVGI